MPIITHYSDAAFIRRIGKFFQPDANSTNHCEGLSKPSIPGHCAQPSSASDQMLICRGVSIQT